MHTTRICGSCSTIAPLTLTLSRKGRGDEPVSPRPARCWVSQAGPRAAQRWGAGLHAPVSSVPLWCNSAQPPRAAAISRGVTAISSFCDRRSTVIGTGLPTRSSVISRCNSSTSPTAMPSTATMMSPLSSPAARARPVGCGRLDAHPGLAGELVEAHDPPRQRHVLSGDPDIAAPHPAVADQPRGDELDRSRRDREADALRHADDRGVDADAPRPRR